MVGAAIFALIQASVQSYMLLYTSKERTGHDLLTGAIIEFHAPCDLVNVKGMWKLLVTQLVSLTLLNIIPFLLVCFLNGAIIKTMSSRAQEWGQEDPQKLVQYKIVGWIPLNYQ